MAVKTFPSNGAVVNFRPFYVKSTHNDNFLATALEFKDANEQSEPICIKSRGFRKRLSLQWWNAGVHADVYARYERL